MNVNKVTIAGNLTRDPELRYTPKGTAVAKLGVAINREWKTDTGEKKQEVTFVDVDCFGKQAETVGQYFKKGKEIYIDGRLKLDSWDDKQTGQKRQRLGVVMESFQFVGRKEQGSDPVPARAVDAGRNEPKDPAAPEEDDVPL